MRVLFVTTEFFWPSSNGGTARTLGQLELLSSMHEVRELHVLTMHEGPVAGERVAELRANLKLASLRLLPHAVHIRRRPALLLGVALRRILLQTPYLGEKWRSRAYARELTSLLKSTKPDVVYIDHLGLAIYLPLIRRIRPSARVVLDEHNVERDLFREQEQASRGLWRRAFRWEADALSTFERDTLRAVDAVVCISDTDRTKLCELSGRSDIVCVPPVMRPRVRTEKTDERARHTACYVGTLSWHPNVKALDWLCAEVWPRVLEREPRASLLVTGRGLPLRDGVPIVPPRWKGRGIEVAGFVQSLPDVYARSAIMLGLVHGGGGLRMKVVEGLRSSMPLIVNSDAIEGIDVTPGREVLVADGADATADAIARLLADSRLQEALASAGLTYIERHHGEELARARLRRVLGGPEA